ncbi:D-malate dehydrogenase [Neomoorella glycerini]|uniref:D-malate dehydrogenase (decarboxylating) n=1 Tax=Neomoorella glycerini TaxID=55779 RepID=A0A6I5ZP35_9FIRM|nr:tartrate dehydrogenase [Moorella glycerini]QGP91377.1 D-malate dehydrogenase [Moorella glycerini]
MTAEYRIAAIPGDGIGPEVLEVGMEVLDAAVEALGSSRLEFQILPWGSEYYLQNGRMMPEDALDILKGFDAIYLGAIGDPRVPDHVSLELLLDIRKGFDQYVNIRPVKLLAGVDSPVKLKPDAVVDFVVIRENTEGEYSRLGGRFKAGTADEVAIQTSIFTRKGTERVIRYAFDLARRRAEEGIARPGGPRPMVTNCTKSNALNYSMVFWDEIYDAVAAEYPDVHRDKALVDALTMWLVRQPEYYDVIVGSNLFADIITDLCAAIQGGMGVAAGGNINPERAYPSMFEPIHGSAPKHKGKNKANPVATIWAGSMMLEHLGDTAAARLVMTAVEAVLAEGKCRTYDLGGRSSTTEVGEAVKKTIRARGDALLRA